MMSKWRRGLIAAALAIGVPAVSAAATPATAEAATSYSAQACFQMQYVNAMGYKSWAAMTNRSVELHVGINGVDNYVTNVVTNNRGCANFAVIGGYWWRVVASFRVCSNTGLGTRCTSYWGASTWQWPTANNWSFGGSAYWIYVPIQ